MRIGVAIDFHATHLSGIGVYGRELLRGLAGTPDLVLTAYYTRDGIPSRMCGLPGLAEKKVPAWPLPTTLRKSLYFATHVVDCDIVHETVQMGFLLPTRERFCKVITVHDLAPIHCPGNYQRHKRYGYQRLIARSLKKADAVIANSRMTADDLCRTFRTIPGLCERLTVTPLAADARFSDIPADPAVVQHYGMEQPTFVFAGMLSPHKNLARVLDAFAAVHEEQPQARLLIAGRRGWCDGALVRRLQTMAPTVQWTGYINDETLANIYRAATALIFPSLYEGFGMPVLEAQASGCPVITSSGIATEETAGGAALLVDPRRTEEIAAAMRRALTDAPLRAELVARGRENAARYSWRKTVDLTLDVYRSLAGRG